VRLSNDETLHFTLKRPLPPLNSKRGNLESLRVRGFSSSKRPRIWVHASLHDSTSHVSTTGQRTHCMTIKKVPIMIEEYLKDSFRTLSQKVFPFFLSVVRTSHFGLRPRCTKLCLVLGQIAFQGGEIFFVLSGHAFTGFSATTVCEPFVHVRGSGL
jgi:hypothetical protein